MSETKTAYVATTSAAKPKREESSHWYTLDGQPCHELPAKKGGMKKVTLRAARELRLLPSVTSILKDVLAAPQLTDWLIERAVMATQTTPREQGEELDAFIERAIALADAEQAEAMDLGTRIHAAIEGWLTGSAEATSPELLPFVQPVFDWFTKSGETVVSCESVLVGGGYAGRCDLISRENGSDYVVDFKSTKTKPATKDAYIGGYPSHVCQIGAYARCHHQRTSRLVITRNVYISTTEPGRIVVREYPEWQDAWLAFERLMEVWFWLKKYDPRKPSETVEQQLDKAGL